LRFVGPNRAWGHRVYTSGMEWVAPPDAPDSQPCTAHCTMYGNRFEPVGTAGRMETAAWTEHRTDEGPIEPDRDDQRPCGEARHPLRLLGLGHLCPSIEDSRRLSKRSNARSSSAARCSIRADAAGGLARTTSRLPLGRRSRRSRIRCRSRRLTLLRTAAPPTALLTTKPTSGISSPVMLRCATRVGRPARLPRLTATSKSSPRRMRECRDSTLDAYRPPVWFTGGRDYQARVDQADSFSRPLRRRAARMARPARVRIRSRKPWVFARRRLFGWKVRLLTGGLQA
jgi:hypothetical protein